MIKYFHIIIFLITHNTKDLKKYYQVEVIKNRNKNFTWLRLIRKYKKYSFDMNTRYWFWWRLANEMYLYGTDKQRKVAQVIEIYLMKNYNVEIMYGAKIGIKPCISHFFSVVITSHAVIGDNFIIKQNSTIGVNTLPESHGNYAEKYNIIIGDNVVVNANVCIISDNITIGSNVLIGAMSFINRNIPDNTVIYTEKNNKIIYKNRYKI